MSEFKDLKNRNQRIINLASRIQEYDPNFKLEDLQDALTLSQQKSRSMKRQERRHEENQKDRNFLNDIFPDPLELAEKLVEFEKASRDTILAAILYPLVRPMGENGFHYNRLNEFAEKFQGSVKRIILDTIGLWALDYPPPGTQEPKENERDFTLMALLAAKSAESILIRSVTSQINISAYADKDLGRDQIQKKFLFNQAKIMARLVYIAGYPRLYNALLNTALQINEPEKYAFIQKIVTTVPQFSNNNKSQPDTTDRVDLLFSDIEEIKKKIVYILENECGLTAQDYTLKWRDKEPHSIASKMEEKHRNAENLDDLHGAIIILHVPPGEHDIAVWAERSREIYKKLSVIYDERHRRIYYRKYVYKGEDARDYYSDPSPTGYQAVQGNLGFVVNNKFVKAEVQIVDAVTHKINQVGSSSHDLLKTKLHPYRDIIVAWKQAYEEISQQGVATTPVDAVAVYDENNDIVVIRGLATAGHFLERTRERRRRNNPRTTPGASRERIHSITRYNRNPLMPNDPTPIDRKSGLLRTGDHVNIKYQT